MAPEPRSTSSTKGKARIYLCKPCGVRHATPTGLRCPLAQANGLVPTPSTSKGAKKSSNRSTTSAPSGSSRPRGRPRKYPLLTDAFPPGTHRYTTPVHGCWFGVATARWYRFIIQRRVVRGPVGRAHLMRPNAVAQTSRLTFVSARTTEKTATPDSSSQIPGTVSHNFSVHPVVTA